MALLQYLVTVVPPGCPFQWEHFSLACRLEGHGALGEHNHQPRCFSTAQGPLVACAGLWLIVMCTGRDEQRVRGRRSWLGRGGPDRTASLEEWGQGLPPAEHLPAQHSWHTNHLWLPWPASLLSGHTGCSTTVRLFPFLGTMRLCASCFDK